MKKQEVYFSFSCQIFMYCALSLLGMSCFLLRCCDNISLFLQTVPHILQVAGLFSVCRLMKCRLALALVGYIWSHSMQHHTGGTWVSSNMMFRLAISETREIVGQTKYDIYMACMKAKCEYKLLHFRKIVIWKTIYY